MKNSLPFLILLALFIFHSFNHQTEAAPTAPFVKHLSSILKWTRSSPKQSQTDGNVIQFESGYLVETVVEGNALGVLPYSIRVSQEGELFAVDAVNSNIVRITPPLSQYSRARFVAGSQGYTGHVDGKPTDARFNHPKGVTMDDKGNVYVADTSNMAIRKIGEAGVTTIAGGKSNIAGYRDGPSEDAKFSNDFDVVYVGRTCSLLVVDRGNAALRQISLNQEDCDNHHSSVTSTDVIMVIGAVLIGYMSCIIQQGVGLSIFTKTFNLHGRTTTTTTTTGSVPVTTKLKSTLIAENKEDQDAGWLSVGRLIMDFAKIGLESLASVFLYYIPVNLRPGKKGLTPIKDSLIMSEDAKPQPETPLVQKQRTPAPISDTRRAPKPTPLKETSAASKHRSSKRQEFTRFYNTGTSETPPPYTQHGSKSQKERTRHRHRDRSGEVRDAASGTEQKSSGEVKPVDYSDSKFDHYNIRNKYGSDDLFNF